MFLLLNILGPYYLVCIALLTIASASVPLDELLAFGTSAGDNLTLDGFAGPIALDKNFTLFNKTHHQLWVSNFGVISMPGRFPGLDACCSMSSDGTAMIIPYGSFVDIRNGGDVFYRQTNQYSDLQKIQAEIQRAFPSAGGVRDGYTYGGAPPPTINWAFIATWNNVSFFLSNTCPNASGIRNTFQAVLASDSTDKSYVIFLYKSLKWTVLVTGNCSGLNGRAGQAGFDFGDGVTLSTLPGSCTDAILNIADSSNSGSPGKWIYSVAHELVPTTMTTAAVVQNVAVNVDQQQMTIDKVVEPITHHHNRKHKLHHKNHHHHQ